jgi:hypothetical protein
MASGSHNRKSKDSLNHVLNSKGKLKLCKCPLHRNNGKGTLLDQTKFKRHTKDGVQGMCADGKTLIDSYSHTLKRLQLLAVVDIGIAFKLLDSFDKIFFPITSIIKDIITKTITQKKPSKINDYKHKLQLLTELDDNLKTNNTNFYDVDLPPADKVLFNKMLHAKINKPILQLMKIKQGKWTKGSFVKDSADGELYPVEEFIFNASKKRELYDKNGVLTPYRINVHNTRAKGQRSSTLRGEKYLADGEYTEANRKMKELGNLNRNIHADHVVPLALGGVHDIKNLVALDGTENNYKKDKLTDEAFELLKKDITYLSHWHHEIFRKHQNESKELVWQYLNNSVHSLRKKVINLSEKKKFKFISNVYPHYKESQINRIIKKHFTKDGN